MTHATQSEELLDAHAESLGRQLGERFTEELKDLREEDKALEGRLSERLPRLAGLVIGAALAEVFRRLALGG